MEKDYKVICEKCEGDSIVGIRDTSQGRLVNWKKIGTVISARERLDAQMGWQCYCSNNSLMTRQEIRGIKNYARPEPKELADIINDLIPELDTGFKMVAI